MVTTNQKSTIDKHTKKKKQSKYNSKDSHQIMRTKEEGKKKRPTETNHKQLRK